MIPLASMGYLAIVIKIGMIRYEDIWIDAYSYCFYFYFKLELWIFRQKIGRDMFCMAWNIGLLLKKEESSADGRKQRSGKRCSTANYCVGRDTTKKKTNVRLIFPELSSISHLNEWTITKKKRKRFQSISLFL